MMRTLLSLLSLLLFSISLQAREYIESFHSDIEIRPNGDIYVTETIVVYAEGQAIKRGIYREFRTRYKNAQGRDMVVGFEVLSIKRNGAVEPYQLESRANGERIYIGDAKVFLPADFYQYEIQYLSTRQLGMFDDFDELYWNVTGNGWNFEIEKASALVSLPQAASDFRLNGYSGRQGSKQQNLQYQRVAANQVYFATTNALRPYEGLTIVVGWPKGIIEEPSETQKRAWFLQDNKSSIIAVGGVLLLLGYYLITWRSVGRDPQAGVVIARYQPPQDYSPASMRYIQKMGYDQKCFTTALINLAVKGTIEIRDDKGTFKLFKLNGAAAALAAGEAEILAALFTLGREHITISQVNHSILSGAISRHKKSLKRDYAKKYFATNGLYLVPGILLTLITAGLAFYSTPSAEDLMISIFMGVFTMIPLIMLFVAARGFWRRGKAGKLHSGANLLGLVIFATIFYQAEFPFLEYAAKVPLIPVGGIILMLGMNYFFHQWLKAPTLAGRKLLDRIGGFKHYLQVAEEDEIALEDAPRFTTGLYETYLPYAIALELENEWTEKLNRAIALGSIEQSYRHPRWYHGYGPAGAHFSNKLSSAFDSAITSASVAPGSSSGSSGGSSGGGGGGGGGGGW